MSYCVNCGVELDKSAKKCALCQTPIINPMEYEASKPVFAPYPDKVVLPAGVRRRYVAFIISMVLLIPNIVCGIINLLIPSSGIWAVYVIATSALVWVLFVQPFLWKKIPPYTLISIDAVAVALYIYVFYAIGNEKGWFYQIAMPMLLVLEAMLLAMVYWLRRKKRDWPDIVIAIFFGVGLYSVFADLLLHLFVEGRPIISFSLVVLACCVALIGFFIAVKRNQRFRAWLGRRFFI
ncbi:MAG TPA: DUF6320 domain-containing protein [Clostridia bacterium]|nr:DUF6320 domain-containing protein [Clostridia bacterium]